ncbi:MAG: hypothetical protein U0175_18010 [Caldilineaceae bacterium]
MKRILILFLVLLMALAPTAVFAQSDETPYVFCGDLDQESCDLLHQSQEAMKEVSSSVQNSEIQLSLQNVPNFPIKDASGKINLDTNFYVDTAFMQEMQDMMKNASESMADDMEGFMKDYMDKVAGVYSHMSFDMGMDIQLSDEVSEYLSSQAGIDIPSDLTIEIRLVDGVMYINLDDISSALPDLNIPTGWYGIDIATLMETQMASAMDQMSNPSEQTQAQMAGMMMGMSLANLSENKDLQDALKNIVILERLDDSEVDGVPVAEIQSTIDFNALLTNETILNMVFEMLKNSGQDIPQLDSTSPAEVAGMLQLVAPMLTQGLDWVQTAQIGLDDGYVYGQTMDMNWDMSSVIQLAAMGSGARPARSKEKTTFEMHVTNNASDFNDAPEISAPEDAVLIPLDAMQ